MDWLEEEEENLEFNFNSLKRKHHLHGYREGLSKGQDYILQTAFNDGFKKSALCLEKLAECRGTISAIYMYLMNTPQFTEETGAQFESLITEMENYENDTKHTEHLQWKSSDEDVNIQDQDKLEGVEESIQCIDTLVESFDKLERTHAGENCQMECDESDKRTDVEPFDEVNRTNTGDNYQVEDDKQTNIEAFDRLKQTDAGENCQVNGEPSKNNVSCCSTLQKSKCSCKREDFLNRDVECSNKLDKNQEFITHVNDKMTEIMSVFDEYTRNNILAYIEKLGDPS